MHFSLIVLLSLLMLFLLLSLLLLSLSKFTQFPSEFPCRKVLECGELLMHQARDLSEGRTACAFYKVIRVAKYCQSVRSHEIEELWQINSLGTFDLFALETSFRYSAGYPERGRHTTLTRRRGSRNSRITSPPCSCGHISPRHILYRGRVRRRGLNTTYACLGNVLLELGDLSRFVLEFLVCSVVAMVMNGCAFVS